MGRPIDNKELKSFFFKNQKAKYEKCLWHTEDCPEKPIRAHAIQNRGALDEIVEDGHVIMCSVKVVDDELHLSFDRVGRKNASTFTGLCSDHDAALFRLIDTNSIDTDDDEHLFLLAYRSVLKEFHANLEAAYRQQSMYLKGVELNELAQDGDAGIMATMLLIESFHCYQTVGAFHSIYRSQEWGSLTNIPITISTPHASVAATGVALPVEAEPYHNPDEPYLLIFNIFPQDGQLVAVFSWQSDVSSEIDKAMRAAIAPILNASGDHQLYLLSKFILKYTETFTLRPSVHATFSIERIGLIQEYFLANGLHNREEWDDTRLFLFGEEPKENRLRKGRVTRQQWPMAGTKQTEDVAYSPKTGRNAPCPCGSGKKYKYCCL